MGYGIYIGEAIIETGLEYGDNDLYITVEEVEVEDAPYWDDRVDVSGKTNSIHPSYTAFSHFLEESNLKDLFMNEEYGLMRNHPGEAVIQNKDYELIREVRINRQNKYPNNEAGWGEGKDSILARLMWFEFWFKWALDNCSVPTIRNI